MSRKIISLIICLSLLVSTFAFSVVTTSAAGDDVIGRYSYTINNPYKRVNWDTWKAYRCATHVHTDRSDAKVAFKDMIEQYYSLGYQGLALTDHGTVNYSWTKNQARLAIFGYQAFKFGNVDELSEERYTQITTGSDRGGDGMIEIPLGIELNGASTSKCHVNSYFADCGHGDLELTATWPETAVQKSQAAGGICHINHVGEWTEGRHDINTYDEDFVNRFSQLFLKYSACIGMEWVNTSDNRTRNDRYLYDQTMKITAPLGRPIWGFCEDDAHYLDDCGNNAQFFVLPQKTTENIRTCMTNGEFFACSKYSKNAHELGDGFVAEGDFPMVSRISVDEIKNQITICPYGATKIKMIADGNVIETIDVNSDNQECTFDLNKHEDEINSYVRFFATGRGGICYVQPFLLTKRAYDRCTAQFTLPSDDTQLTVRDSAGNMVEPANSDNYYLLNKGEYTYKAERNDYESDTGTIIVTDSDISGAVQKKINITLDRILIRPVVGGSATVNYENRLIYGLRPGLRETDFPNYVKPASGASIRYIQTGRGFGTGALASVSDSDGGVKNYTLVIFGDIDGDGCYDGQDAVYLSLIANGMLTRDRVGEALWLASDCNHDGAIDGDDVDIVTETGLKLAEIAQSDKV